MYSDIGTIRASEVGRVIVRCIPRSFLSAFHSPADSTRSSLPLSVPARRLRSGPGRRERSFIERGVDDLRKIHVEPRRWSTHGEARTRSAHCNSGSRLEAERGSWIKNGFGSVFIQPVLSGVQLPAREPRLAHGSFARSLLRVPLQENFTFTTPRTWPTSRSLASSLARSLVHSLVHPSIYTLRRRFCPSVPGPGVRRGPEFHRKSLGYIFTSGAIKAVGVRRFLD